MEPATDVEFATDRADRSHGARLTAYGAVSRSLARCSDLTLRKMLESAVPMGSGVGGSSALVDVAGTPVFVKRVPLTDLERRPENVRSTANLFDLPTFCHYGVGAVGAPSFGAWRELAVHTMTTNWVLTAEHPGFPLMYHWRVLPDSMSLPEEWADVQRAVSYWGGGSPVRTRIEALEHASASIALFLEYIPQNLHQWLGSQVDAGDDATNRACAMVDKHLQAGVSFMNERGLLHFDTHFENILTDGQRLYFADYGLATSSHFDLAPQEIDFLARHQDYDRCYAVTFLVNWLVTALYGYRADDRDGRYALVRGYADGQHPTGIAREAAEIISRHAPVAAVVSEFNLRFQRQGRHVPYPVEEIHRLVRDSFVR